MRLSRQQRGDTIIEVMLAFAVFSMVAVGAITVMNRGASGAQDTLETTLVRQQVDAQADTLRFMHTAYLASPDDANVNGLPAKFRAIVTLADEAERTGGIQQATEYGAACTQTIPGDAAYRFVLNPKSGARLPAANIRPAGATEAPAYAQVTSEPVAYGLWIEPIMSNADADAGTARYIDFHIRACWTGAASTVQRTLGTIVRLYVPANVETGTAGGEVGGLPVPEIVPFTVLGNTMTCRTHAVLEGSDSFNPTWLPSQTANYQPTENPVNGCVTNTRGVASCPNYDAGFKPADYGTVTPGSYQMIIKYDDFDCGRDRPGPPYGYKVSVFVNDDKRGDYTLNAPEGSFKIDNIGPLDPGSRVTIRWWNNHYYSPLLEDPDLLIEYAELTRLP